MKIIDFSTPSYELHEQYAYTREILGKMQDKERAKLCMRDPNIMELLRHQSHKRLPGQSVATNTRNLANLLFRFFDPLFKKLKVETTNELLVSKHARAIIMYLSEFGGLEDFRRNHEGYRQKVQDKEVRQHRTNSKKLQLTRIVFYCRKVSEKDKTQER